VITLVSGTGTVEKRETAQDQINLYSITLNKKTLVEFELPADMALFQIGQKVKVSISNRLPKTRQPILILQGNVYNIEKTKTSTNYIIFFSGLQGQIQVKRAITSLKAKKPIFISISA
jgi:hypothetical protein